MPQVSIEQFIKTGQLGDVKLGMSREDVIGVLGQPATWGGHEHHQRASIWKYGLFEFWFPKFNENDNGLYGIFSDHFTDENITDDEANIGWGVFYPLPTMPVVARYLDQAGLTYTSDTSVEQITLTIDQSNVKLSFNNQSLILQTMIVLRGLNIPKNRTKQLNLHLPIEAYEKVQQISQARKISISKLCSEWLTEYIEDLDSTD